MSMSKENKKTVFQFLKKKHYQYKTGWQNFTGNLVLPDAIVIDVQNESELPALLNFINQLNDETNDCIKVREAAGGRKIICKQKPYSESYSTNEGAKADVILRLNGASFQKIQLKDLSNKIIRVGAGVQTGELHQKLYSKYKMVLPVSSLIKWVTLVGLAANSGHGTGRDQPSVAGLIVGMRIMRPDGSIVYIDRAHPDFETIRGCHLGLFGIVLNVDVQCIRAKKLKCVIEPCNINEFKKAVKNGLYQNNEYVSVMYVPTFRENESAASCPKNVLIMRFIPVPLSTPDTNNQSDFEFFGQELMMRLQELFGITKLLSHYPNLISYFMRYVVAQIEVGFKNKIVVGPWPDIMHYQYAYPRDLSVQDNLFNVSPDCHEIVTAIDHLVETLDFYAKKHQYPIIYGAYWRYFLGTNGGLSTSFHKENQHVFGLDITSGKSVSGFDQFSKDIQKFLMKNFNARPHWGKMVPENLDYEKIYGAQFYEFKKVLNRWYFNCNMKLEKSIFLNSYFDHILKMNVNKTYDYCDNKKCEGQDCELDRIASDVLNYLKKQDQNFYENDIACELEHQLLEIMTKEKNHKIKKKHQFFSKMTNQEGCLPSKIFPLEKGKNWLRRFF